MPLPAPGGLASCRVTFSDEEYLVLTFPMGGQAVGDAERGLWLLTAAEREVAMAAVAGRSNHAIAARRRVSGRTIANQLASIYRKLRLNSRAELAAWWHGLRGAE